MIKRLPRHALILNSAGGVFVMAKRVLNLEQAGLRKFPPEKAAAPHADGEIRASVRCEHFFQPPEKCEEQVKWWADVQIGVTLSPRFALGSDASENVIEIDVGALNGIPYHT